VTILVEDESARNKLLMPLRRIKKRYEIEVCLDMGEQRWVNLIDVSNKFSVLSKKIAKQLAEDPNATMSHADEEFIIEYECFV
jgi:hypothetical protein